MSTPLAIPRPLARAAALVPGATLPVTVHALRPDGLIEVDAGGAAPLVAAWLENAANAAVTLAPGDRVLMLVAQAPDDHVVLGRIGRVPAPAPQDLVLEAGRSLTLRCGASSLDLRADGRVVLRGEDVLLRAAGTQRIRAGTVSIN